MKRKIARAIKQLLNRLPQELAAKLLRWHMPLDLSPIEDMQFKVAETEEEAAQALRLVHDAYVEIGYIAPQPHGLRIMPHHLLPSTVLLIAKWRGEVVGTMTVVRDGASRLPMEEAFIVAQLRGPQDRLAELSCLAIRQDFRRQLGGRVLIYLMKYMYEFCTSYFGVSRLLVTVHPKDAIFYQGLLGFRRVSRKVQYYMGAPAIGLWLDLKPAKDWFKSTYGQRSSGSNLYHFFVEMKCLAFSFPSRVWSEIDYPTPAPRLASGHLWNKEQRRSWLDRRSGETSTRRASRIAVDSTAKIHGSDPAQVMEIKIHDISPGGFTASVAEPLKLNEPVVIFLNLPGQETARLMARPVWSGEGGVYGFSLEETTQSWQSLIAALQNRFGIDLEGLDLTAEKKAA